MPRILSIFILALLPSIVYAQNDTTYLNEDMMPTQWSFAAYYQVVYPRHKGHTKVDVYYINNKLKSEVYYKLFDANNAKASVHDGSYTEYYKNGYFKSVSYYKNNKQIKEQTDYYENPDSAVHAIWYAGRKDHADSLHSFYPDGKLKRIEYYAYDYNAMGYDSVLSGKCFSESGTPIPFHALSCYAQTYR